VSNSASSTVLFPRVPCGACCYVGFVPATDLLRNASGAHKFYTRYVLGGMLRFTRQTRTVTQAGAAIGAVATGDKFKGSALISNILNNTRIRSVEHGICPIATFYSSRVAP